MTKRESPKVAKLYKPTLDYIKSEYKGYNYIFALSHCIQRLIVLTKYPSSYNYYLAMKSLLKSTQELLELETLRKDIYIKDLQDFQMIRFPIQTINTN